MRPNPDQVGEGALVVPIEHGTTPPSLRFGAPWRGACRDVGLRRAQSSRLAKSGRLINQGSKAKLFSGKSLPRKTSLPPRLEQSLFGDRLSLAVPPKISCKRVPSASMSSPRLDGCQSGRLGTPGERVYRKVPRVRIPPHPKYLEIWYLRMRFEPKSPNL